MYRRSAFWFLSFAISVLLISCSSRRDIDAHATEYTIAFGSCNKQWEPQPMWEQIVKNDPDLWIWTGDIIYADTEDMDEMKAMYDTQKSNKQYQLLKNRCPIIGVWDDHDYGANNAGKEFAKKAESRDLLFDFLDIPSKDPARQRQGAYQSYEYNIDDILLKVILLDVRYFRDTLGTPDGTMLGLDQWEWFESELKKSNADINIIAGGVQFLHVDHGYEKWYNYPKDYVRLLSLLSAPHVKNPILISGDRHIAEVAALTHRDQLITEVTSSGMTHSYEALKRETNRYRKGPLVTVKNFGLLKISNHKVDIELHNEQNDVLYRHTVMLD